MAVPKGYRPIGIRYKFKIDADREAKRARKVYGDNDIVRPIKSGKFDLYYQIYWKRNR